jgi:O-antigen/teichoic acid export membrane protein
MASETDEDVDELPEAGGAAAPRAVAASKPEAREPASRTQPPLHAVLRVVLGGAGLLLVVGFFLPWFRLPNEDHSGLSLVFDGDRAVREMVSETQRWVLLAIPVLGVVLTAVGFMGARWAAVVSIVVGVLLLGYGIVTAITLFFEHTGLGLWLIVGGAFLAIGAGAYGFGRARAATSGDSPKPGAKSARGA